MRASRRRQNTRMMSKRLCPRQITGRALKKVFGQLSPPEYKRNRRGMKKNL